MKQWLDATTRHGAYLPHWTKSGATYHVRFRLTDSLPQKILQAWKEEKEEIIRTATAKKRPLTSYEKHRLEELSSEAVERYLHNGYGACWLQQDVIAHTVAEALRHNDRKQYRLHAWCVMPNHVHVIVEPINACSLDRILHEWKRISARKANKLLRRSGPFWQAESFDHIIRNEESFQHAIEYVWQNPEAAGLKNWKWRWKASE